MTDAITQPDIEIVRTFDAPRELVWKAWTTPDRFAAWFGAPGATCPPEHCEMDVRPGGAWRALMHAGEHGDIHWHGAFEQVDEPEQLVFTISDQPVISSTNARSSCATSATVAPRWSSARPAATWTPRATARPRRAGAGSSTRSPSSSLDM